MKAFTEEFPGALLSREIEALSDEDLHSLKEADIKEKLIEKINLGLKVSEQANTPEKMREIERVILLHNVDKNWMDNIDAMDDLRQTVSTRSYANKDPLVEYRFAADEMFEGVVSEIKRDTVRDLLLVRIRTGEEVKRQRVAKESAAGTAEAMNAGTEKAKPKVKTAAEKVGRNDPCPCGSGKKYKKCCGRVPGSDD